MSFRRPKSLKEVANLAKRGSEFHARLREFLDAFYSLPSLRCRAIKDEPPLTGDPIADAYIAAAAEHLALTYRLPVPHWVHEPMRFLHAPFFAGRDGMKAMLLVESPMAFRRRMLFVDYDRSRGHGGAGASRCRLNGGRPRRRPDNRDVNGVRAKALPPGPANDGHVIPAR